jgi:hypothetical protein
MKNLILLLFTFASLSALGQNQNHVGDKPLHDPAEIAARFQQFVDIGVLGTLDNLKYWGDAPLNNLYEIDTRLAIELKELGFKNLKEAKRFPGKMERMREVAIKAFSSSVTGDLNEAKQRFEWAAKNCDEFKNFGMGKVNSAEDALQ